METTGRKPPQAFERQMPPVKVGAARGLRSPDLQFTKLSFARTPTSLGGGAAGGLRSPDLQFLRRGRLRLRIRNCRSAGLSYGGASRPESCGRYQGYGTMSRWTKALSSTVESVPRLV